MASNAAAAEEDKTWEEMLRRMLPAGAPLPDEEHLDYSIAVEYVGPPVPYEVPKVDPLDIASAPSRAHSVASVSEHTSIPVVMPINPRFSRFGRFRNGTFSKEPRSPVESQRSSSVSRSQLDLQNGEGEDHSDSGDGVTEGARSSVSSPRAPNSVPRGDGVIEVKRPTTVTFNTPKDSENEEDDGFPSPRSVATEPVGSPVAVRNSQVGSNKRWICSRCGKGNRLKEKEACLVCDRRYCSNCVLKAMGSMPEGRKCVSCIGQPIDESKRSSLGKCSRMLSRVCSPLEIKQIMKAEKECPANQLRPEQLVVNGRQLRQEELAEILGCAMPPQKLKPGRYWYDKDSGLWGKVKWKYWFDDARFFQKLFLIVCVFLYLTLK